MQWTCTCSSRTRDATPLPAVASKAKARPRRLHHGSSARRAAPPPAFDGSSAARGRGERPKARGDQVGGGSVTEGASPAPPVPRGGATCASERPAGRGGRAWTCRGRVVDVSLPGRGLSLLRSLLRSRAPRWVNLGSSRAISGHLTSAVGRGEGRLRRWQVILGVNAAIAGQSGAGASVVRPFGCARQHP